MWSPANYQAVKNWFKSKIIWTEFGSAHVWLKLTHYSFFLQKSMKCIVLKNTYGVSWFTYFFFLIGVTELRSVHVHTINLSNKGEMVHFNQERMTVLGLRSILLWTGLYASVSSFIFYHYSGPLLIPSSLIFALFYFQNKNERKKTEICSFLSFDSETCKTSMLQSSPLVNSL